MSARARAGARAQRPPAAAGGALPGGDRWPRGLLYAGALLVVARVAMAMAMPFASEDAYITFRYARMLVTGHGLVFNPGEAVMGFTSLPWALWCALGMLAHADPVWWTRASSLIADLCALTLGWRLLGTTAGPAAARIFAFGFAGWPLFAASSASGLETSVFFMLLLLAASLAVRRSRAAGPILGLLAVWRPEGLAAAAIVAIAADGRARLVALGVVAMAVAGLTLAYGSPVPQSVLAKAYLYGTPGPWEGRHWWEWLLPFPIGRYPIVGEGIALMPLALIFAGAIVSGARTMAVRPWSAAAFAAAGGICVWLGYATLGVAYFWWYLVVPLGSFLLVAAAGMPQLVKGRTLLVLAALTVLGSWTVSFKLYVGRAQAEFNAFAPAANLLRDRGVPGESVLLEPIGLIGYRSELRVLDETGLVSPVVAQRRLRGAGWYSDIITRSRPEWLVARVDALESGQAFAGSGALFRSAAERDSTLMLYDVVAAASPSAGEPFMILRRRAVPSSDGTR